MKKMTCEWRNLLFVNYQVPAEILEPYLPPHAELDYFNGKCYVSLIGFQFKNVTAAGIPVPFHTDFEEINLRFYVKRHVGDKWRSGVVFLREIVDRPALSVLANTLFNENYQTAPTTQMVIKGDLDLQAKYSWKHQKTDYSIWVQAENIPTTVAEKSEDEFLIHRLWGYGQQDDETTVEYNINHPRWSIFPIKNYEVSVDFLQFGTPFSILNDKKPQSVLLADGSEIEIIGSSSITN